MEDKKFEVKVLEELCKGCGLCIGNCPRSLFKFSGKINAKGYDTAEWLGHPAYFSQEQIREFAEKKPEFVAGNLSCVGCKVCYDVCPEAAIKIYKQKDDSTKILKEE